MSVEPAQPHKEQQYRKCGSTISVYKVLSVSCGRNALACLRKPIALDTLAERAVICSFQLRELSITTPRHRLYWITSTILAKVPGTLSKHYEKL